MLPSLGVDLVNAADLKVVAEDDATEADRSTTPVTSRWGYLEAAGARAWGCWIWRWRQGRESTGATVICGHAIGDEVV
ncbi:hypothetical protein E2562_025454 [Oryza meyeriana var. granulata]|uniref:Uncharacterized protein n=1 Tax=Oryza meyeriana var. granulata TaxID=110450 RepID=A0A6G1D859_9ORYZ|nr:hypothetical protein E2562_025454 [Oryza meyeriana var. granulata]